MTDADDPLSATASRSPDPPTNAPVSRVRDVIVCLSGAPEFSLDEYKARLPIGSPTSVRSGGSPDPMPLGRDASIGWLASADAKLVVDACTPRGHHFNPVGVPGQRFSLMREIDLGQYESNRSLGTPTACCTTACR